MIVSLLIVFIFLFLIWQCFDGCAERREILWNFLPMLFGPPVPFEGQLKQQPSFFLISKGTKYSQYLNNSLLAYCSIFLFILLIVSCLLGSQTCWWPLNSLCVFVLWSACVCAHARVCVITSVSSRSMCSLCVLSCYHIFSCSPHRLPVIGLKSGVLFHQVSK